MHLRHADLGNDGHGALHQIETRPLLGLGHHLRRRLARTDLSDPKRAMSSTQIAGARSSWAPSPPRSGAAARRCRRPTAGTLRGRAGDAILGAADDVYPQQPARAPVARRPSGTEPNKNKPARYRYGRFCVDRENRMWAGRGVGLDPLRYSSKSGFSQCTFASASCAKSAT